MNNIANIIPIIDEIIEKLKSIPSVKGIVIGGSFATNRQRKDSDIDLGIFYHENSLLDIHAIKELANYYNDFPNPVVTNLCAWGEWINGGAWLTIKNQRIDFLYRNIDFMKKVIDESERGIIKVDYFQQPAFGFYSYIYCAEIFESKIIYDPEEVLKNLKSKVLPYPKELKKTVVNKFLWDAEFTLLSAFKFAKRDNILSLAGSLTRITNDLVQVVYALNEVYFINEKNIPADIQIFKIKPHAFMSKLDQAICNIGEYQNTSYAVVENCKSLIKEVTLLTEDFYKPPFNLEYV